MKCMTRKGYGRIYVGCAEDVAAVDAIIKEMDEFEHYYLPAGYIAPFSEYPRVEFTHKFCDMDMDALTATCWSRGIRIWCFDAGDAEFPRDQRVAVSKGEGE